MTTSWNADSSETLSEKENLQEKKEFYIKANEKSVELSENR